MPEVARHLENTITLAAVLATAALLCLVAAGGAAVRWASNLMQAELGK